MRAAGRAGATREDVENKFRAPEDTHAYFIGEVTHLHWREISVEYDTGEFESFGAGSKLTDLAMREK